MYTSQGAREENMSGVHKSRSWGREHVWCTQVKVLGKRTCLVYTSQGPGEENMSGVHKSRC